MNGYYINAYQIVEAYFDRIDSPIPNNVNKYIDYVIKGERRIDTGSTRIPHKRYYRRGVDPEFDGMKVLLPKELMRFNTISTEQGRVLSNFTQGRYVILRDPQAINLDCVVILYEGMILDNETGYPLVPSMHDEVLIDFLEYMDKRNEYYNDTNAPRYKYQDLKDELDDAILDIRAKDITPSDETLAEVNIINNSLIAPQFIDKFTEHQDNGIIITDVSKGIINVPSYDIPPFPKDYGEGEYLLTRQDGFYKWVEIN